MNIAKLKPAAAEAFLNPPAMKVSGKNLQLLQLHTRAYLVRGASSAASNCIGVQSTSTHTITSCGRARAVQKVIFHLQRVRRGLTIWRLSNIFRFIEFHKRTPQIRGRNLTWRHETIRFETCSMEARNSFDLLLKSGCKGAKRLVTYMKHLETKPIDYLEESSRFVHANHVWDDTQYFVIKLEASGILNGKLVSLYSIENADEAGVLFFIILNACHIDSFYHLSERSSRIQHAVALFPDAKMAG